MKNLARSDLFCKSSLAYTARPLLAVFLAVLSISAIFAVPDPISLSRFYFDNYFPPLLQLEDPIRYYMKQNSSAPELPLLNFLHFLYLR